MTGLRSISLVGALAALAGCGDSTSPNPMAAVAGTYHATRIVFTEPGSPQIDAIALGTTLEIVLSPTGTTSGTLLVPAVLSEDGISDVTVDLAGTFTVEGNTLTFHGGANSDSFITDVAWTIGSGTLTTNSLLNGGTFEATLTRS
jgi:hypothetical protein